MVRKHYTEFVRKYRCVCIEQKKTEIFTLFDVSLKPTWMIFDQRISGIHEFPFEGFIHSFNKCVIVFLSPRPKHRSQRVRWSIEGSVEYDF